MLEDMAYLFIYQVLVLGYKDDRVAKLSVLREEYDPFGTTFLIPRTAVKHGLALINNEKRLFFYDLATAVPLVVLVRKVHEKINGKLFITYFLDDSVIV